MADFSSRGFEESPVSRRLLACSFSHCVSAPRSRAKLPGGSSSPSFAPGMRAPTSPSRGQSKGLAMFLNQKERLSEGGPTDDSGLDSGHPGGAPYSLGSGALGIVFCL